jgi:hypothetical protein
MVTATAITAFAPVTAVIVRVTVTLVTRVIPSWAIIVCYHGVSCFNSGLTTTVRTTTVTYTATAVTIVAIIFAAFTIRRIKIVW